VSTESDVHGYDVASRLGHHPSLELGDPASVLRIEAKSMSGVARGRFRLFLTRNEWDTAQANGGRYLFYLLDHVSASEADSTGVLVGVLTADDMFPYVPVDAQDGSCWTECRVVVDLGGLSEPAC
jgi:hypothetical protein